MEIATLSTHQTRLVVGNGESEVVLPDELVLLILSHLSDARDLARARQICRATRRIIDDPQLWRCILKRGVPCWLSLVPDEEVRLTAVAVHRGLARLQERSATLAWRPFALPAGATEVGDYRWARMGDLHLLVGMARRPARDYTVGCAVCCWELPSGRLVRTIAAEGAQGHLRLLPFNSGELLIASRVGHSMKVWSLLTGAECMTAEGAFGMPLRIEGGWRLAVGIDRRIEILDPRDGSQTGSVEVEGGVVDLTQGSWRERGVAKRALFALLNNGDVERLDLTAEGEIERERRRYPWRGTPFLTGLHYIAWLPDGGDGGWLAVDRLNINNRNYELTLASVPGDREVVSSRHGFGIATWMRVEGDTCLLLSSGTNRVCQVSLRDGATTVTADRAAKVVLLECNSSSWLGRVVDPANPFVPAGLPQDRSRIALGGVELEASGEILTADHYLVARRRKGRIEVANLAEPLPAQPEKRGGVIVPILVAFVAMAAMRQFVRHWRATPHVGVPLSQP